MSPEQDHVIILAGHVTAMTCGWESSVMYKVIDQYNCNKLLRYIFKFIIAVAPPTLAPVQTFQIWWAIVGLVGVLVVAVGVVVVVVVIVIFKKKKRRNKVLIYIQWNHRYLKDPEDIN